MIITADYIVTGDGKTVLENAAVRVENGRIAALSSAEELTAKYPDEPVQAYPGCTLMPGMIDMHVHIGFVAGRPDQHNFDQYRAMQGFFVGKRMADTLKNGVTTIRDVSSPDHVGISIPKARAAGYIQAPRVITCGDGICMTGGHGSGFGIGVIESDGPIEVRKAVRKNIRAGATCIKILTSEGWRGLEMTQEEIDAAVDEAHRLGVRIAAHAGYGPSIEMCISAGCDTIEHGTHLTAEQALYMKEHDQTWVPTIYVFENSIPTAKAHGVPDSHPIMQYYYDAHRCYESDFKRLYDVGVRVACGTDTDCDNLPEASPVATECEWMVRYGLTPLQAIECATKNGGEALGMGESLGLIKENYLADIIAVKGKPHEDIVALHNIEAVYQDGKLLKL